MTTDDALYAWVTTMPDGRRSIVGIINPFDNRHMPLIAFERTTMEGFRPVALAHGRALGQPVAFVRFGGFEVIEGYPK